MNDELAIKCHQCFRLISEPLSNEYLESISHGASVCPCIVDAMASEILTIRAIRVQHLSAMETDMLLTGRTSCFVTKNGITKVSSGTIVLQ